MLKQDHVREVSVDQFVAAFLPRTLENVNAALVADNLQWTALHEESNEDEEMDGTGAMNEAEKEERRRERRRMEKERRKALGNRPELSGIDAK